MRINYIILFLFIFLSACSQVNSDKLSEEQNQEEQINEETPENQAPSVIDFKEISKIKNIRDAEPFYPMDETVEDIQNQINNLKSRVIEYESKINRVALDPDLLKMIKAPTLSHEVELINGTIVQGSILQEDIDRIILKTQIGQIRIEKADIVSIKEIAPNSPDLSFESEPEQKLYDDKRIFTGTIINEGIRRADFARVIFYLWDEETNLIVSDSSFVNGTIIQYKSGIVTDCAVESGESASYEISVSVPDTSNIRYITKEIHFSIYE